MEANTVVLSLDKYNELRSFKENIEKGKILTLTKTYGFGGGSSTSFYTESEIVGQVLEENENLKNDIEKLGKKIFDLTSPEPKQITIDDVRKMSYWEFRKWRKQL